MTLDERVARLEALAAAMPSGYATSKYSVEEIDAFLDKSARGGDSRNLLINADFRNPVNRNGKTVYTASGYTIDRWRVWGSLTVSVDSDGITLSSTSGVSEGFFQYLDPSGFDNGSVYTISALTNDNHLLSATGVLSNGIFAFGEFGGIQLALNEPEHYPTFAIVINGNSSKKFKAAKVDFGSRQTLAHQDEDGNWVLNDPPNYDLQYALCSQYSPINGEWVGSQHSNPTLLDNGYFVGGGSQAGDGKFPINQKGQMEYSGVGTYAFDRWLLVSNGPPVLCTLTDSGVTITTSGAGGIQQRTPWDFSQNNNPVTCSVIINGSLESRMISIPTIDGNTGNIEAEIAPNISIVLSKAGNILHFTIWRFSAGTFTLEAAKLELGPVQTLAHQDTDGNWVLNDPPPDKAQELAKCQRYYQVFATEALRPTNAADFRPVMRINPTLGTINIDGVTYYTADANL